MQRTKCPIPPAKTGSTVSYWCQVHGTALASWLFLPHNATAVHIRHQPHYYEVHEWADDLVSWHGTARHGTAWHGMAQHSTEQNSTARHWGMLDPAQRSTA
jgi:hypothetical protein